MQRVSRGKRWDHAVVIGGSMSGLLASRVLSDFFEEVTLVERDHFPGPGEHRKGVPQGRHLHGLLASGLRTMKDLFPGLEEELIEAGAVPGDFADSLRWFQFGGYKARFDSGLRGVALSRTLLESVIRKRTLGIPNVRTRQGYSATALVPDAGGSRITGVRIQDRRGGREETHDADLVVDASGRGSRTPAWLRTLGFPGPEEETIRIDMGYATCTFRRKPEDLPGINGLFIAPKPPFERRAGAILAVEGDRWIVTLAGIVGDHAPADEQGYFDFARSLPVADLYEVIKDAEPLSAPTSYRFPANLRRRYERLKRFPGSYLVLGDALCSFNPVYGQGMSVAALEAIALRTCLEEELHTGGLQELPRRFFKRAARIVDIPWTLAAGADLSYSGVEGRRPPGTNAANWYVARLHEAAMRDQQVCHLFFEVANLLKPPSHLFKPTVMLRVLRETYTAHRQHQAPAHRPAAALPREH